MGSPSFCGDGICEAAEEATCATDCVKTCQEVYHTCETDEGCPEGYFCDFNQGVSVVTGSNSDGGPSYEYLGVCSLDGSGGGSGGAGDAGTSDTDTSNSASTNESTAAVSTSGGNADGSAVSGSGGSSNGDTDVGDTGNASGHNGGVGPLWPPKPHRGCSVGGVAARSS